MTNQPFANIAPEKLSLSQKQRLHCWCVAQLLVFAYANGYQVSWGETVRSDEQAEINALGPAGRAELIQMLKGKFQPLADKLINNVGSGIRRTLHDSDFKLAIDLNLFKDGVYLNRSVDHGPLGMFWETLHPLCRWGGRFNDGNHYSIEHEGRK